MTAKPALSCDVKVLREALIRAADALQDAGTSLRDMGNGLHGRKALMEAKHIDNILAEPVDREPVSTGA